MDNIGRYTEGHMINFTPRQTLDRMIECLAKITSCVAWSATAIIVPVILSSHPHS